MNKKEIITMIQELIVGVQGKHDNELTKIDIIEDRLDDGANGKDYIKAQISLLTSFQLLLEHTEGQLYELNYVLSKITKDGRRKDY
jgi:hypothetical protein